MENKNFTPIMTYCGGFVVFAATYLLMLGGLITWPYEMNVGGINIPATIIFIWCFGGLIYLLGL